MFATSAYPAELSMKILKENLRGTGISVFVGCEQKSSAELATDLAKTGNWLIHAIALKNANHAKFAKQVSESRLDGIVTVEKIPIKPFPYRNNLIDLIIVENLEIAKNAGFSKNEALCSLAPFGKLYINSKGKWDETTKTMPKEMDNWTHPLHGADANPVSDDKIIKFPLGYRWNAGLPINIHSYPYSGYSKTRGLAVNEGRIFTLSDSVLENLGDTVKSKYGRDQYITARNAFNGLFLWRTKIGEIFYPGIYTGNYAPFIAIDKNIIIPGEGNKILVLNTETGEI